MSLSRTALRLAAIEALCPKAALDGTIPFPTMAGRHVYDSGIGPEPTTEADKRSPRIAAYTDDGKRDLIDGAISLDTPSSGVTMVTLAFELFIPGVVIDADGNRLPGLVAETDALAEGMLDLLGAQIVSALDRARMTGPLHHVVKVIEKIETRGWRDADSDLRLSSHRLEFEIAVANQKDFPVGQTGLARLPFPLGAVAAALPEGSYGHDICTALAAAIVDPQALPALQELRFTATVDGLVAPTVGASVTDLDE